MNDQLLYHSYVFGWNRIPIIFKPGDKITIDSRRINNDGTNTRQNVSIYYTPRP